MDPVSIVVTALALGAAASSKPTVGKVVEDAYEEVKTLIKRKYNSPVNFGLLATEPESKARQEVLREELAKLSAGCDHELLAQTKALLDLVREYAPEVPETIEIRFEDVVAASLTLDEFISSDIGASANKLNT